jgi:hypothetical protein
VNQSRLPYCLREKRRSSGNASPWKQVTLDNIEDKIFNDNTFGWTIEVDIKGNLAGFKACGEPLNRVIARLTLTNLNAEYFPR